LSVLNAERKAFAEDYMEFDGSRAKIYYLGECMFHRHMLSDTVWAKKEQTSPYHSSAFRMNCMQIVVLLAPCGSLYWEIRGGSYNDKDYNELLGKLFRILRQKKQSKFPGVLIVEESVLKEHPLIAEKAKETSMRILSPPPRSILLNPLAQLFQSIGEKASGSMSVTHAAKLRALEDLVNDYSKEKFLKMIEESKEEIKRFLE
jgi:hypothetical protein